ncbi:DNA topoisomerase-3 [Carnobacterium iners]|uniref:DNA topoisomerase n=1 Tax=Carnobacterium iners TaxID=1073423 RepID=A0A1X7MYJ5_9LACT|nr:type IA DNA topoisomerase [Carnobacterium iners]SEK19310.1 DNA topoisomerase-3 [Carnobacterium iners]SMH29970.1 DNA topoisomerase-3 [Carnobacterium iners]
MGMTLILAEKPSQAKAYAESFGKFSQKDGYIILNSSNTMITWGFGHLVELASPEDYKEEWKKWSMKELPIIPETFKFKVGSGKAKQFNVIKKLLREADRIVIATDSDREGESIARSIINQAKVGNKEIKRLWINSLESEEIQKGFSDLRDGKEFYSTYIEAQTRQISDWLVGINLSRMYTLSLQKKGINEGVFSVGRVQTPTLYMIYSRQKEREEFIPEAFFEMYANIKAENGAFKAKYNKKFATKKDLQELIKKHHLLPNNHGVISSVEMKHISQPSPLLFSLSDLQSLINKKYKISPSDTLKHVQTLYEAKLVSYPRSDCRHITDSEFHYLVERIADYQSILDYTIKQPNTSKRKRYVDGSKVQEHYALIPTKKIPTQKELAKLTSNQKNIYFTILKRTLAMFETDFKYDETTIIVDIKGLPFTSKGRTIIDKGWRKLEYSTSKSSEKKEPTELPLVQKNEAVEADLFTSEGFTTPPKLYTEGTLITAMKTCGKELENKEEKEILKTTEGIGTEATRANVIETLKKQHYIVSQKNEVSVTQKGTILCQAVADTLLSSPEMTAKWETYLKKIKNEEGTQEAFLATIQKFIRHTLSSSTQVIEKKDWSTYHTNTNQTKQKIAQCPICGQSIIDKGKLYGCSGYSNGCTFTLPKWYVGKGLSEATIKNLIRTKETQVLKGFKKKDGQTFSAALLLTEDYKLLFKPYEKTKK